MEGEPRRVVSFPRRPPPPPSAGLREVLLRSLTIPLFSKVRDNPQ
jgi:hypothetical protein